MIDLSKNNLGDDFAAELANTLASNEILYKVDISNNPITAKGANSLLKVLKESNDTLTSLGDIEA
jgi:disulfide oxidoreductase YuzD